LIRQGYQTVDYLAYLRLEIARVEALHKRKDDKKHKDKVNNGNRIMFIAMIQGPMLTECIEDIILSLPS
jgi:branched-subunit amino acid permease